MRYYQLLLNGKILCSQSFGNPTGLQIQFNIQTYNEGEAANTEITVYNPPLWMFGAYAALYDQKLTLNAGIAETPITKIIGIKPPTKDLIVSGYIAAVIPDWNKSDAQIKFILKQAPNYKQDTTTNLIDMTQFPGSYQFNLKAGVDPSPQIKACVNAIAPGVPYTSRVSGITTPAECLTPIWSTSSLGTLLSTWGLVLLRGAEGYILDYRESSSYAQTVYFTTKDFLTQPSAIDVSTIAVTTFIRGDIRLGDRIFIPQRTFVGLSQVGNSVRDSAGLDAYLNTKNQNIFTMFTGYFKVNKIWHVGDLRNTDPQSWATHMEVVKL